MSFPVFDPDRIRFQTNTLEGWISSLPENTELRVFHTDSEGAKQTWIEDLSSNTIFLVKEVFNE
jgi:hypothetical protein